MALLLQLAVVYVVLTFVLRRFPYTRPWGESMRGFLLDTLTTLGLGVAHALPGLFTVAVILLIARIVTRVIAYLLQTQSKRGVSRRLPGCIGRRHSRPAVC